MIPQGQKQVTAFYSIFTTKEEIKSHQIWRVRLKKACYAHLKFLMFLAGKSSLRQLEPSYLVQSRFLLTTENLVFISETNFEKFKFEHFPLSIPSLVTMKIIFKRLFLYELGRELTEKRFKIEFLKSCKPQLEPTFA